MKISIEELKEIVISPYSSLLPDSITSAYLKGLVQGSKFVEVPNSFPANVATARAKYSVEEAERIMKEDENNEVSKHRLSGMEKEKCADNEGAMSEYAIAIILGEQSSFNLFSAYAHAYERLIVCLHKAKKYDKEVGYIERYLKYDLSESARAKYSARLEKLKSKIDIA